MIRYIVVSISSGVLFGAMDGLINANPLTTRLYEFYQPIARTAINVPAGVVIDLIYGFLLAGIFLLIYRSLPGDAGLTKGISYAVLVWFLRVVMSAVSGWMMFNVPTGALLYNLITGLGEMLILGILYGLTLKPSI